MAKDHSLPLRRAIVKALLAAAAVTAICEGRIYGEEPPPTPEWPFIRYGLPEVDSYEASCWDGGTHPVTIHCFARGPGMDACSELAAAVSATLENSDLALVGLELVAIDFVRTQIIRDSDEAGAYHAIVQFSVTTAQEA